MLKTIGYAFLLIISSVLLSGCAEDRSERSVRSDREYELEERADRLRQDLDDREQELQERQDSIENAKYELDSGDYSDAYDTLDEY